MDSLVAKRRDKVVKGRRKKQKTAFVVSVIGEEDSDERKHSDKVLNNIIRPALKFGDVFYKADRIDNKGGVGPITQLIIESLKKADLVICDLTHLNANVMYEMGIRQAWHLPLIPIIHAPQLKNLPFDIKDLRTVPYEFSSEKSINKAIEEIRKQIISIQKGVYGCDILRNAYLFLGRRFAMDYVYKAFKDALNDMYKSFHKCRRTMRLQAPWEDPHCLEELSNDIGQVFDILSHKMHVFDQIAIGNVWDLESSDQALMEALDEICKLEKDGVKMTRIITSKEDTASKKTKALVLIEKLLKGVKSIAKNIDNKKM